jgi:hypothetical protein
MLRALARQRAQPPHPRRESNPDDELRTLAPGSARTGALLRIASLGLPARSRTSTTGFVDRCLHPAGQGDSAPPGTRTRIGSLRRRVLVHRARGAESREGIKPSHAVLQTALLSENRLGAGRGNRTHIGSLEDCGPTVERCPQMTVPQAGRPGRWNRRDSNSHRPGANRALSGDSVGHHDSPTHEGQRDTFRRAPRRGIEPLSPHGQWGCDASRITRRNRRRAERRAE